MKKRGQPLTRDSSKLQGEVPGLETSQKILLKCGANKASDLRCYWNLVEKVNGKGVQRIADSL